MEDLDFSPKSSEGKDAPTSTPHPRSGSSIRTYLQEWAGRQAQGNSAISSPIPVHPRPEYSPWNTLKISNEDAKSSKESEQGQTAADVSYFDNDRHEHAECSNESLDGLAPGCLIGSARGHRHDLAILVQIFNLGGPLFQLYTSEGRYIHMHPPRGIFCAPEFASSQEISRILPYLPSKPQLTKAYEVDESNENPVPRQAGSHLLKKINDFKTASDDFYRNHAHGLDNIYDCLHLSKQLAVRHLREVARQLCRGGDMIITDPMAWAVLKAVRKSPGILVPIQKVGNDLKILVMPTYKVQTIRNVCDWMRDYQESVTQETVNSFDGPSATSAATATNPISKFVRKARKLVLESRRRRSAFHLGNIGPDRKKLVSNSSSHKPQLPSIFTSPSAETFDSGDRVILHFLSSWAITREIAAPERVQSIGPMILRAIGLYEGHDLGLATGLTFLKEIGFILPWENRALHTPSLDLHGPEDRKPNGIGTRMSTTPSSGITQRFSLDAMKEFRRDLQSSNIYCIDSKSTTERDDGLSIERVDENTFWVHVHIANPSAFINPTDEVAKNAYFMMSNLYLPERRYAMFPPWFTEDHFSLAPGVPVITFSAKLSTTAEILDSKISHNRLRDTVVLAYEELDEILMSGAMENIGTGLSFEVGRRVDSSDHRREKGKTALSEAQLEELKKLWDLSAALKRRRNADQWWQFYLPKNIVSVKLGEEHPHFRRYFFQPLRVAGDPWIGSRPPERAKSSDRCTRNDLVPEFMIMACQIAGDWCKRRQIPAFYAGTPPDPGLERLRADFYAKVARPTIDRYGYVPPQICVRYASLLSGARYTSTATPHQNIPADAYLRVTSPLRRWVDLVAHWQIESALREEAKTGREAGLSSDPDQYLVYSKRQIEAKLQYVVERNFMLHGVSKISEVHWFTQLFYRAHFFQEAPLPATINLSMYRVYPSPLGWASELGMFCGIAPCEALRSGDMSVGDTWECRIKEVECYQDGVLLEPVRLIEKGQMGFI